MNAPRFFDSFPHLDSLLASLGSSVDAAQSLHSPNTEDDEFIRCGMIGFARHLSLDRWDFDHFQYVQAMSDEVSDGTFSEGWRRFTCLAAGYFLGMRVAGLINDVDLKLSEFHTQGFMHMHPKAFDPVPTGGGPAAG
jgi:hypothetical protein